MRRHSYDKGEAAFSCADLMLLLHVSIALIRHSIEASARAQSG